MGKDDNAQREQTLVPPYCYDDELLYLKKATAAHPSIGGGVEESISFSPIIFVHKYHCVDICPNLLALLLSTSYYN